MASPEKEMVVLPYGHRRRRSAIILRVIMWIAVAASASFAVWCLLPKPVSPDVQAARKTFRSMGRYHLDLIGMTIRLFCGDHGGRYPDALADLVISERLPAEMLISPPSTDTPAVLPAAPATPQQIAAALAVPGHVSFVYLGKGWIDGQIPVDAIVAYERPGCLPDGSFVLYANGETDWFDKARVERLIAAASATTQPVSASDVK